MIRGKGKMRHIKSRIIAVLMAALLAVPAVNTLDAEAATSCSGQINATELYLRQGPGTQFDRVETSGGPVLLTRDMEVKVYGETDGWYLISVGIDGERAIGYSSAQFIAAEQKVSKVSDSVALSRAVITASELYMRKGPGTEYENVMDGDKKVLLVNGQQVTVLAEDNGWYLICADIDGKRFFGYSLGTYIEVRSEKAELSDVTGDNATPVKTPEKGEGGNDGKQGGENAGGENDGKQGGENTGNGNNEGTDGKTNISFTTPVEYDGHTIAGFIGKKTKLPEEYERGSVSYSVKYKLAAMPEADGLEVRKTATDLSTVIARIPAGTQIYVTGTSTSSALVNGKYKDVRWYRVLTVVDGTPVRGYCLSTDVVITDSFDCTTRYKNQVIRSKTSTSSAAVKTSKGKKVSLVKGTTVGITGETMKKGVKWFKVEAVYKKETVTGYIPADRLSLSGESSKITLYYPVLKPEYVTPAVTDTPDNGENGESTNTGTGDLPGMTGTPENPSGTPENPDGGGDVSGDNGGTSATPLPTVTPDYRFESANALIMDAPSLCVKLEPRYSSESLFLDNKPVFIYSGQPVELISTVYSDGVSWCYIRFLFNNTVCCGYVNSMYVLSDDGTGVGASGEGSETKTLDFESKLAVQGFPESYKPYLRALHEKYPEWEFEAFHTGLDWNDVIKAETEAGINLLPNTKSVEWKSLEAGAYSWKTDTFTVFDGSTWVTASKAATEYYMDPRNFLAEDTVFQFEKLTYNPSYQTRAGIDTILKNTAMNGTGYTYTDENGMTREISYTDTFAMAAEYSGVSPLHLASRVKQEVSLGAKAMSNSVTGTVAGFEGLYNFYNIGAYNSTVSGGAIANGLNYARNGSSSASLNMKCLFPWNNRLRSIFGGAFYIGNNYINRGQDTIYLQKFNVTSNNTYNHQYMGNIEAPYSEGKRLLAAYEDPAALAVVFSIPVYENMPGSACPVPEKQYNPNNWLSSLKLYDKNGDKIGLTPSFSVTSSQEYSIIVDNSTDYIKIKATAVSSKANIISNNYFYPEVGVNRMVISVQAENGVIRDYVVNVVREEAPVPTAEPAPESTPEITPEVTPETTPEATTETTPEATPETTPETTPEVTPETTPEATPETTPETTPEVTPETTPENVT